MQTEQFSVKKVDYVRNLVWSLLFPPEKASRETVHSFPFPSMARLWATIWPEWSCLWQRINWVRLWYGCIKRSHPIVYLMSMASFIMPAPPHSLSSINKSSAHVIYRLLCFKAHPYPSLIWLERWNKRNYSATQNAWFGSHFSYYNAHSECVGYWLGITVLS